MYYLRVGGGPPAFPTSQGIVGHSMYLPVVYNCKKEKFFLPYHSFRLLCFCFPLGPANSSGRTLSPLSLLRFPSRHPPSLLNLDILPRQVVFFSANL